MGTNGARALTAPGHVRLADYDPGDTGHVGKEEAERQLPILAQRLSDLQELLYAAGRQSVLIVLQGVDTAGKDGTLRHVATALNPAGCTVAAFKEPTEEELGHDFLWRIHRQAPARGMIAFFNRSHYEDVLVARIHKLVPEQEWKQRYDEINDFERLLARNGTLILKFFLHISKEEQRERLLAREREPDKAWKLAAADWQERAYWDDYKAAYEDALGRCAAEWAPWHVVPSNHKWYRNYVVARTVVERLERHEASWKEELVERGKRELEALREAHIHDAERGD